MTAFADLTHPAALATSLRIEETVAFSWPQVYWENRENPPGAEGQHSRPIPLTAETRRFSARPSTRKLAVFVFVARPGSTLEVFPVV